MNRPIDAHWWASRINTSLLIAIVTGSLMAGLSALIGGVTDALAVIWNMAVGMLFGLVIGGPLALVVLITITGAVKIRGAAPTLLAGTLIGGAISLIVGGILLRHIANANWWALTVGGPLIGGLWAAVRVRSDRQTYERLSHVD